MAQTLTVNDKTYDIDDLSDEAKGLVNNIRYSWLSCSAKVP